jgi:hypothetical protein
VEHEVLLLHRIVNGKIVQEYAQADVRAAMQQIGMPIGRVAPYEKLEMSASKK